jgi:hypothetical protein
MRSLRLSVGVCIVLLAPGVALGQGKARSRPGKAKAKAVTPAVPESPPRTPSPAPSPPESNPPPAPPVVPADPSPAPPQLLKPRLAVLGIDAAELPAELRAGAEDVMSQVVAELAELEVVTTADLRAVLQLGQIQQLTGCMEASCASQAGDMLAVQQTISGSVRVAGEGYVITVQRFDLVNDRSLGQQTVETAREPAALLDGMRRAVPPLFGVVGRIVLWDQPGDAEVFVNGRLIGRTPVGPVVVKSAGMQEVAVLGPGLIPWNDRVDLAPGKELRLRVRADSIVALEAEAASRRRLGWGLAGGGAAAAVLAGGLYFLAYDNDKSLDGLDLRTTSQDRLDAITGRTLGFVVAAVISGIAALACGGTGTYLLLDNPAADRLATNHLD